MEQSCSYALGLCFRIKRGQIRIFLLNATESYLMTHHPDVALMFQLKKSPYTFSLPCA